MDIDSFLQEFQSAPVWHGVGQRAPHKALALLYAMSQLQRGHSHRLVRYVDAEAPLKQLLDQFGPPRRTHHPEQPVWRLRKNNQTPSTIWEVTNSDRISQDDGGNPVIGDLRKYATFGVSEEAAELFKRDPEALIQAAAIIADSITPETLRDELLAAVQLDVAQLPNLNPSLTFRLQDHVRVRTMRAVRDPMFSKNVLQAYGWQCAICGAAPKVDSRHFGLEAAHIRWHQYSGPNTIDNGLSLCRMHHVALDRGALSVTPDGVIEVSPRLDNSAESHQLFGVHSGRNIRRPAEPHQYPAIAACEWHRHEVFRAG
jgi:putative restriction endonuclease